MRTFLLGLIGCAFLVAPAHAQVETDIAVDLDAVDEFFMVGMSLDTTGEYWVSFNYIDLGLSGTSGVDIQHAGGTTRFFHAGNAFETIYGDWEYRLSRTGTEGTGAGPDILVDKDGSPFVPFYLTNVDANAGTATILFSAAGVSDLKSVAPSLNFSEGDVFGTTTFAPATTVPIVVGLLEGAAEDAIGAAFLLVGNTTRAPSDTVNVNEVISSDPAGDTDVIQFSSVDLVVSDGPQTVFVPAVVGGLHVDAINAIEGAFLVATSSFQFDNSVQIDRVISQDPPGGTEVDPGSIVELVVSDGRPVSVPDVVQETQEDAEADILAAGLVADVTLQADDIVPAGLVISQDPPGGASVIEGSTVDLFVSQPVSLGFVTVGDPGNAADPATDFGAVADTYMIGETEVTNAQYAEFLNAKAVLGDPLGLYDEKMADDPPDIRRNGFIFFTYNVVAGRENKPITHVSFYDALRFANWLNNGAGSGDTETGSYTLEGGTAIPSNGPTVTRNASASIALTSEDEWYKAAYYDAASMSYNPYPFADGFNGAACEVPPGTTSHSASCLGAVVDGSDVGDYTSPSDYGTFDQGGNVSEWNEAIIGSERGERGGNWNGTADRLAASVWDSDSPTAEDAFTGFRVVNVPEPDQVIGLLAGLITLALLRWKASSRGSMRGPGFAGRT